MTDFPTSTVVVVGASMAGAGPATAARAAGHDGRIVMIGEEATVPYERPPLPNAVLRGEVRRGGGDLGRGGVAQLEVNVVAAAVVNV